MKKSLIAVLLSGIISLSASAANVGIVDGEALFESYPSAQAASKKIADAQEDLRETIADSEKAYSELEANMKSEAEKLTKQREFQAKIDEKAKATRELVESISAQLENDIVGSIKKIADSKKLEVVFDKRAVLVGGTDITDEVVAELAKKSAEKK